jgi:ketosteroid isomerase-like protein
MSLRAVCTIAASLVLALRASAQMPTSGEVAAGQTTITLPDTSAYSPAARRILALEVKRSAAIAAHDTAWLATVYAPDFRGVAAGGRRVDRPTLFQVFSRDAPGLRFTIDELEVRDFGAAATVMGRLRTLRGGELAGESRYLHTYIRRGNHWWIVAAAGSAVPPDADRH